MSGGANIVEQYAGAFEIYSRALSPDAKRKEEKPKKDFC